MVISQTPPTDASNRSPGEELDRELAGLDELEQSTARRDTARRVWRATWPKVAAIVLFFAIWQIVVWSGWKPTYVLPGPATVFEKLRDDWAAISEAAFNTLRRAAFGFAVSIVIGTALGALCAMSRIVRSAIGSFITGLQSMPSIAWFPLAILLFTLSEEAILFVVVIGAAPSIANGLIGGVDNVPPVLTRVGRVLGANPIERFIHVTLPASLPTYVAGLKQGWAFAWRSLLAGELLVIIPGKFSLGQRLQFEREFADSAGLIAVMLVILVIGILMDLVVFGSIERFVRRRHGLAIER